MTKERIHDRGHFSELGATALSLDTRRPLISVRSSDGAVTEHHGECDVVGLISGEPFSGRRYALDRKVNQDGEILDRRLQIFPILSAETKERLMDVVRANRERLYTPLVARTLFSRLPHIQVTPDSPIEIKISGLKKVAIGVNPSKESEEKLKGRNGFKRFTLPISNADFFRGLDGGEGLSPVGTLMMREGSLGNMIGEVGEIIQKGTFSEGRFRSFVNVTFDIALKPMEDRESLSI